jgi:hypothetical protein
MIRRRVERYIGYVARVVAGHARDFLARSVDSGGVERRDVVNDRLVVRRKIVRASSGRVSGLGARFHAEIVQPSNAFDHGTERRRYGRFGRVRIVRLSIHEVGMNLGLKRRLHLSRHSAYGDRIARPRYRKDLQSLPLQSKYSIALNPLALSVFRRARFRTLLHDCSPCNILLRWHAGRGRGASSRGKSSYFPCTLRFLTIRGPLFQFTALLFSRLRWHGYSRGGYLDPAVEVGRTA